MAVVLSVAVVLLLILVHIGAARAVSKRAKPESANREAKSARVIDVTNHPERSGGQIGV